MIRIIAKGALLALALNSSAVAQSNAGDVTEYQYDDIGRLKKVLRTRMGSSTTADYTYDKADNRNAIVSTKSEINCQVNPGEQHFRISGTGYMHHPGRIWIGVSGHCAGPIIVSYTTENGTALSGVNYQHSSGQFTIDPNNYYGNGYNLGWVMLHNSTSLNFFVRFQVQSGNALLSQERAEIGLHLD